MHKRVLWIFRKGPFLIRCVHKMKSIFSRDWKTGKSTFILVLSWFFRQLFEIGIEKGHQSNFHHFFVTVSDRIFNIFQRWNWFFWMKIKWTNGTRLESPFVFMLLCSATLQHILQSVTRGEGVKSFVIISCNLIEFLLLSHKMRPVSCSFLPSHSICCGV